MIKAPVMNDPAGIVTVAGDSILSGHSAALSGDICKMTASIAANRISDGLRQWIIVISWFGLPVSLCRRFGHQLALQTPVEVVRTFFEQRVHHAGEKVIGAGKGFLRDKDALLRLQFFHQALDILFRGHPIGVAVNDQARRRTGGKKGKVVDIRLRRDRHETLDLGPPHQQLHADPGAEGIAGNPASFAVRMQTLDPVERCSRV